MYLLRCEMAWWFLRQPFSWAQFYHLGTQVHIEVRNMEWRTRIYRTMGCHRLNFSSQNQESHLAFQSMALHQCQQGRQIRLQHRVALHSEQHYVDTEYHQHSLQWHLSHMTRSWWVNHHILHALYSQHYQIDQQCGSWDIQGGMWLFSFIETYK